MSDSFGALASDFYVNQRLNLKMDLPTERETVLNMFDRVRKEFPGMERFRRYQQELALEGESGENTQQWLALRKTSIRSGVINPGTPQEAYRLHQLVLETAPYFLSISPLDVDFLELLYGFDLMSSGNHDAIVFDALYGRTPLAALADIRGMIPVDCQPVVGVSLSDDLTLQAHFEIKTRTPRQPGRTGEANAAEPISVYLALRKYGSVKEISELGTIFETMSRHGEELLNSRVIPNLVVPIRQVLGTAE
jgi:hypothetical protein